MGAPPKNGSSGNYEPGKENISWQKEASIYAVYYAKQQAQSKYFEDINTNNDRNKIFKMIQTVKDTNKDVTGE